MLEQLHVEVNSEHGWHVPHSQAHAISIHLQPPVRPHLHMRCMWAIMWICIP